jgi:hypothetical protein
MMYTENFLLKPFKEANINSGLKLKTHWLVVK